MIIVSVAVYHTTYGQVAFLKYKDSEISALKDIYDEDMILEYFLIINSVLAIMISLINYTILMRREIVLDDQPVFYKADIKGQEAEKHLTIA